MDKEGRRFRVVATKKQRRTGGSIQIVFPSREYARMNTSFEEQHRANFEGYAVAECGVKALAGTKARAYLVRSLHIPSPGEYVEHSSISVTPSAEFMERTLSSASEHNAMVLEIHTHPGSDEPRFSSVDFGKGLENGRFLRSCRTRFGMLVAGSRGCSFMEYDVEGDSMLVPGSVALSVIDRSGLSQVMPVKAARDDSQVPPAFDRQVRIWGEECQRKIAGTTAGIVGLGGTGSMVLQMLARLGVRKYVLCDPDLVEEPNLNRIPYAFAGDVGRKKTRVASGYLKKLGQDLEVRTINERVQDAPAGLGRCDVLFGCVDNDGARLALNGAALRYFIPYIDTGAEIFVEEDSVRGIGGQVRVVVPAVTGCLECAGAIDHEQAAAGFLAADDVAMRHAAGYVHGTGQTPAPAAITLNATLASMAVQEFVDMAACRPRDSQQNYLIYDASLPGIERLSFERREACPMCGPAGVLGAGDPQKGAKARLKMAQG
jgi:hypothetical protein